MSGSSISWAICKSAPRSRQTTTPAPQSNISSFYRPDALLCCPTNNIKALKAKVIDTVLQVLKNVVQEYKNEWRGAGVVICLERGADLHMAQLMPLPLTVSCFSKFQIGFTFLVLAHLGSPGQRVVKQGV